MKADDPYNTFEGFWHCSTAHFRSVSGSFVGADFGSLWESILAFSLAQLWLCLGVLFSFVRDSCRFKFSVEFWSRV